MIKIGVIGCGNMGRNHVRVLFGLSSLYKVVGIYDLDATNCEFIKKTYGIGSYNSAEELIQDVDAVLIATPSETHLNCGLKCIEKTKNVFIEKPLAATSKEAVALKEKAEEKGVKLMVGHIETFNPVTSELKKIISKEEIISLDFHRLSPFDKRVAATDVIIDLMIHDIYNLQYLVGNSVKQVKSTGVKIYSEKTDYAQALIEFESGELASLTASRITEGKERKLNVNTKGAFITVDYINRSIEISRKTKYKLDLGYDTDYVQENIVEKVFVPMKEPLVAELEHFANCINNDELPMASGCEGVAALALCEKIID